MKDLTSGILKNELRSLAKAITLVESTLPKHRQEAQDILQKILPQTGKTIRIGITGTPGVGKSTFIEAFGKFLTGQGKKVAVLAVDPSSPVSGGSILGDKTRMEKLSQDDKAFIRPSPTSGSLGGVANRTRESMLLCEAAGYDIVLIETVGVGQSEYEVASMVDFFLVLMLPNAGDELQGIKKGILEIADAIIINKDDGDHSVAAQRTKQEYANALHILGQRSFWLPQVLTCSSINNTGITDIWDMITDFIKQSKDGNFFESKRKDQNINWLHKLIQDLLKERLAGTDFVELESKVGDKSLSPYQAADQVIQKLFKE